MEISQNPIINNIFSIVYNYSTSIAYNTHHIDHIIRVHKLCLKIAKTEKTNLFILEAAAILHDLGRFLDDKEDKHEIKSAEKAKEILEGLKIDNETISSICDAIISHRYSKGIIPQTIEGKILQDADKLDALGAIGIARVLCYKPNQTLYNFNSDKKDFENQSGFALYHFYEKILKLDKLLYTQKAKEIAKERIAFTRVFLEKLKEEI